MFRKALGVVFLVAVIATVADAATRKPLMEEFTNVQCGPCASAHPALEQFMANHEGELTSVWYHMYWPGYDPWWADNTVENGARRNVYGVNSVPSNRIDAIEPASYPYTVTVLEARYNAAMMIPCHAEIDMSGIWVQGGGFGTVDITLTAEQSLGDGLYLHVALVENECPWNGTGNYDIHDYVMHDLLTGSAGEALVPFNGPYPENRDFTYSWAISDDWNVPAVEENLLLVAWIQRQSTREILQSEMVAVADFIVVDTPDVVDVVPPPHLGAIHPNPFNPTTNIPIVMPESGKVDVRIYGADGTLVRTLVQSTLAAGETSYTWDGVNDAGDPVASGVYYVHMITESNVTSRPITLLK